jgi:hypothetical protein
MSSDNWYDFPDGDRRTKRPVQRQGTVINKHTHTDSVVMSAMQPITNRSATDQKDAVTCTTNTNTGGKQKWLFLGTGFINLLHTHTLIRQKSKERS